MTGNELIALLSKLSAKDRDLPVEIDYSYSVDGSDWEETDTVDGAVAAVGRILLSHG